MTLLSRCVVTTAAVVDKFAAREGDSALQKLTKRVSTSLLAVTLVVLSLGAVSIRERNSLLLNWSLVFFIAWDVVLMIYLRATRDASLRFVGALTAFFTMTLMVNDMIAAAESNRRIWPFSIILIDLLLVIRAPPWLTTVVVGSVCAYITGVQAEETWRFGLFDMSILAPYEDRVCQGLCDEPPCPRRVLESLSALFTSAALFLLDFYFTRGFA
eukprot:Rhum_TRINITY_DN14995_c1_g1::Rhum_TRINITY_DN14995_c1_g1_i1::g.131128::m.131128